MRNSKQKRKYLKSVSKTFSTDSPNFHSVQSNEHEVSTLLNKLRHESRPKNSQRSTETLPTPAHKYLMRDYLNRIEGEQRERVEDDLRLRVSGPLPPKSWRGVWYSEAIDNRNDSDKLQSQIEVRKAKKSAWNGERKFSLPFLIFFPDYCIFINIIKLLYFNALI